MFTLAIGGNEMMKRVFLGVATLLFTGSAMAQLQGVARAGVMGGVYDSEISGGGVSETSTEASYGVLGGYTFAWESTFFDIAAEYQTVDGGSDGADFDRTDVLLSLGVFLPKGFTASYGYRFGFQGDGFIEDDFYKETGPFVGAGFPAFSLFGQWELSTSTALNFTKLSIPGVPEDPSFFGVSARGAVSKPGSPHTVGLRVQHFMDDESGFKLTETYAHLFYQISFAGFSR